MPTHREHASAATLWAGRSGRRGAAALRRVQQGAVGIGGEALPACIPEGAGEERESEGEKRREKGEEGRTI
jgi:hypothetical protein